MIETFELLVPTPHAWTECVIDHFDAFLLDHAACEKKAAGMATSMVSHYPDKPQLVLAMCDLAIEEMCHFREVVKLLQRRGLQLSKDEKDPYIHQLLGFVAKGKGADAYFLDRLLMAAVVEARGAERFSLIAAAFECTAVESEQELYRFYKAIAQSEARHYTLFLQLAQLYFSHEKIAARLNQWLVFEAEIILKLTIKPTLH